MQKIDSLNLRKIEAIIKKHGWLGPESVGYVGNKAFFFVIQHAGIDSQKRYFNMMLNALAKGYIDKYQMAYLIDRISLREKRLLMFGSEVREDRESKKYFLTPTWGIDSLDARRELVGLQPMAVYLKQYGISWNPVAYEAKLPELMEKLGF